MKRGVVSTVSRSLFTLMILAAIVGGLVLLRQVIMNPISWFVVACGVFFICCGGVVHIILHHAPLFGTTRNERGELEYEYISTGVRVPLNVSSNENNMRGKGSSRLFSVWRISYSIVLACGGTLIGLYFIPVIS